MSQQESRTTAAASMKLTGDNFSAEKVCTSSFFAPQKKKNTWMTHSPPPLPSTYPVLTPET